jgi:hypothetical protein
MKNFTGRKFDILYSGSVKWMAFIKETARKCRGNKTVFINFTLSKSCRKIGDTRFGWQVRETSSQNTVFRGKHSFGVTAQRFCVWGCFQSHYYPGPFPLLDSIQNTLYLQNRFYFRLLVTGFYYYRELNITKTVNLCYYYYFKTKCFANFGRLQATKLLKGMEYNYVHYLLLINEVLISYFSFYTL